MSQVEILPPFLYRQPRMDDVEDVEKYVPGGYHPVNIGDIIGTGDQRYEVIHKLAYGGFSTVWLVRSCGEVRSYFALKVLCANVGDLHELDVLQYLRETAGPHPNVVKFHHSFKVSGPNGEHECLVFEVLGPNLQNHRVAEALSGPVRNRVCDQVVSAMAFLNKHEICHGEDLRLSNGSYWPHAPKQVVQTPDLSGLDYSLLSNARIIDFGEAFFADRPPPSLGVPIDFFPLELCFGYPPSTKSDIWQLACVLFTVHDGNFMFPTFFRIFEALIGTAVAYLGPLPQEWKGMFMFDLYGYREPGRAQNRIEPAWWFEDKYPQKAIDSRLSKDAPHLPPRQRVELVRLLNDMVGYEPKKRLSAADVVQRLRSAVFWTDTQVDSTSLNVSSSDRTCVKVNGQ